jgi:hypothetical protein
MEEHHENSKKYIIDELKGEIEQLRSFLCNQQTEFDNIRTRLEKELDKTTNINDSLKKTNDINKAEINELHKYLEKLHDKIDRRDSKTSNNNDINYTETEVNLKTDHDQDSYNSNENTYDNSNQNSNENSNEDKDNHYNDVEISVRSPQSSRPPVIYQSVNKKAIVRALTAVNVLDDDMEESEELELDLNNTNDDKYKPKLKTAITNDMPYSEHVELEKVVNDWDDNANKTLKKWYDTFKEISHMYQFILDRNYKISSHLSMISVVSSSCLSIFSGFKLWMENDKVFQSTSDVIMLVSNFVVAGITTMSKRYIDDNRNEKIRIFIEEVDRFISLVYAQYCLAPVYRTNATEFFRDNTETFTKLMTMSPNLSIYEMKISKLNYQQCIDEFKNV